MEWKNKVDECCADELEEIIIDNMKAGFFSNDKIVELCVEHAEDYYPDDCETITDEKFPTIIQMYREKYQNTGKQVNFLKLDAAFHNLWKQGIVALHYAGYTQTDGFDDCNEVCVEREENGEKTLAAVFIPYRIWDISYTMRARCSIFPLEIILTRQLPKKWDKQYTENE
ncbi:MAG: hypothetical protein HFH37_12375 [Lachnospiraceae bacterium]|jgi:hypothetical protein|nr:hypothetical protein [Lachnospiraceae bacterium]